MTHEHAPCSCGHPDRSGWTHGRVCVNEQPAVTAPAGDDRAADEDGLRWWQTAIAAALTLAPFAALLAYMVRGS